MSKFILQMLAGTWKTIETYEEEEEAISHKEDLVKDSMPDFRIIEKYNIDYDLYYILQQTVYVYDEGFWTKKNNVWKWEKYTGFCWKTIGTYEDEEDAIFHKEELIEKYTAKFESNYRIIEI